MSKVYKKSTRVASTGRVNISISLPPQMGELIDRAAGEQMQNRSEFVRAAVREKLLAEREPIVPTKAEEREFEEAMRDYRAGRNILSLKDLRAELEGYTTHKKSTKGFRRCKRNRYHLVG